MNVREEVFIPDTADLWDDIDSLMKRAFLYIARNIFRAE